MKEINEKLLRVQAELKAPKSQFNDFGKYAYRSAEDILVAVKPLLAKNGLTLTISDEVLLIGDRFYVRATATVSDGDESVCVAALAREEAERKGMDGAQITGSASSYARKYALNGLFAIDDNKDPDAIPVPKEYKEKTTDTEDAVEAPIKGVTAKKCDAVKDTGKDEKPAHGPQEASEKTSDIKKASTDKKPVAKPAEKKTDDIKKPADKKYASKADGERVEITHDYAANFVCRFTARGARQSMRLGDMNDKQLLYCLTNNDMPDENDVLYECIMLLLSEMGVN